MEVAAMDREPLALARAHSGYFLFGGLWPLLHLPSFEAVLGRKRDDWLVQTVALIITGLGASLGVSARRGKVPLEMRLAAASAAVGLGAVAAVYGARGRISRLYLVDAAVELAFAALWMRSLTAERGELMGTVGETAGAGYRYPPGPEPAIAPTSLTAAETSTAEPPLPQRRSSQTVGPRPSVRPTTESRKTDTSRPTASQAAAPRPAPAPPAAPPSAAPQSNSSARGEASRTKAAPTPAAERALRGAARRPEPVAADVADEAMLPAPSAASSSASPPQAGTTGAPAASERRPAAATDTEPTPAAVAEAVVVCVFFDRKEAEAALEELLDSGYDDADVTLAASGGQVLDHEQGSFKRGALELTVHPRPGSRDPEEIMNRHGGRPREDRTTV
ncbi:MAG: hypothetical protein ABR525_06200 [Candidatus Limnocylindria bacterium]